MIGSDFHSRKWGQQALTGSAVVWAGGLAALAYSPGAAQGAGGWEAGGGQTFLDRWISGQILLAGNVDGDIMLIALGAILLIAVLAGVWMWTRMLRRQVQIQLEELQANETKFSTLFNSMDDIVFTLDPDLRYTAVYGPWVKRSGLNPDFFIGRTAIEIFGEQIGPQHESAGRRALAGENVVYDWSATDQQGTHYYQTSLSAVYNDKHCVTGLVGVGRDITSLKRSEAATRESELLYRLLADNMVDVVWVLNVNRMKFTYVSPSVVNLRGFTVEEVLTQPVNEAVTPESLRLILSLLQNELPRFQADPTYTTRMTHEVDQPCKDGSIVHTEVSTNVVINPQGEIEIIGVSRDITERKQNETALRESENRFRSVVEQSSDGILIVGEGGAVIESNQAAGRIIGLEAGQVVGKPFWDLQYGMLPPGERTEAAYQSTRERLLDALQKGQSELFERAIDYSLERPDGELRHVQQVIFPISTSQGHRLGSILRDMTAQKQTETHLKHSQARLLAMLNAIPDLMFLLSSQGVYLDYHATDESKLAVSPAFFLGKKVSDVLSPDLAGRFLASFNQAIASGQTQVLEYKLNLQDGVRDFEASIAGVDQDRCLAIVRDVTERKISEKKIQASLHEKEMLLKEIHHRVKNNMQVIVSLLSLQSYHIKDAPALALFKESQERIHAMALVHEKLYQSADLARIDFSDYLVELAERLRFVFQVNNLIDVQVDAPEAWLGVDAAIPCGLIANELISNALKHAYPDGRSGRVQVVFRKTVSNGQAGEGSGMYHLTIRDFGVGLPPDFDPAKAPSLGLQLVHVLAHQVDGNLKFDRTAGLGIEIEFCEKGG